MADTYVFGSLAETYMRGFSCAADGATSVIPDEGCCYTRLRLRAGLCRVPACADSLSCRDVTGPT